MARDLYKLAEEGFDFNTRLHESLEEYVFQDKLSEAKKIAKKFYSYYDSQEEALNHIVTQLYSFYYKILNVILDNKASLVIKEEPTSTSKVFRCAFLWCWKGELEQSSFYGPAMKLLPHAEYDKRGRIVFASSTIGMDRAFEIQYNVIMSPFAYWFDVDPYFITNLAVW